MIYRYFITILLISSLVQTTPAQVKDTLASRTLMYRSIVPMTLAGAGILINHSQFEIDLKENLNSRLGEDFQSKIDDYFQYFPIAEMYLADALGVKSRNHWFDQTKFLLISNLITYGITHGLKNITQKERPNGSSRSFPSGHSSFAFTNATVLKNEFQGTAPLLAYSGYAFATTTGVYRMLKNRHWLSDVLLGAGIGMLVTELVYYFEPFKAFNPFKKSGSVTFIPAISGQQIGFYFSCHL
jgi:hypothetical protein